MKTNKCLKNLKGLHEECGVVGVFGPENASELLYLGLHALQHRGQEGSGIATANDGKLNLVKGAGLVHETFNIANIKKLEGDRGIGHVFYPKGNEGDIAMVQPILFRHSKGDFAIANNGSLVNGAEIRQYLESKGSIFQSYSDAETIAHMIKNDKKDLLISIKETATKLEGSFSFLVLTSNTIYAVRDKYGLKPLAIGKLKDGYIVASETCAFELVDAKYIRDVEPGEIVIINNEGMKSVKYSEYRHYNMCAMEYIYFARPDSDIENFNVHKYRKETGRLLAIESPADADIVVGVPDSSLSAAMGYAEASGIPNETGLIKNKYVGRTFIQPSQGLRERTVKMKLSTVESVIRGKRVVLVDDSIVRGTTSKYIINLLREAGAAEVHLRICSPQMTHPCFYGVDTTSLIGAKKTCEEIRKTIGADSLAFISIESLYKAGGRKELCTACFSGKYPTNIYNLLNEEKNKNSQDDK